MFDFTGKAAFVTGATGGIGRATAEAFVAGGARVLLADIDGAALERVAAEIGGTTAIAVCDVTSESATQAAVDLAVQRFGGIDIAVLNAGIEGPVAPIGTVSLAAFQAVINVNVTGVFIGLNTIMPVMQRKGGGVITILSSTAGRRGSAGFCPYITSKHAVMGMMKTAAMEGAADGIRVNTVNPGPIETRMMRQIERNTSAEDPDAIKAAFVAAIPMGRYGTAEEVADMIAFLSSARASYCTGNYYGVDGGLTAG